MSNEYEFKVIMVGDAGIGKTTMIASLMGDPLPHTYVQTQGTKVSNYVTEYRGKKVTLKLWDLSGGDTYRTYVAGCFGGAHAAIIGYSMTDSETLLHLRDWHDMMKNVYDINGPDSFESLQKVVVGFKCESKVVTVSSSQGEDCAKSLNCPYFEATKVDDKSYKDILWKILDALFARTSVKDRNKEKLYSERKNTPRIVDDDPSQPLLNKNKAAPPQEKQTPSICGCGPCVIS